MPGPPWGSCGHARAFRRATTRLQHLTKARCPPCPRPAAADNLGLQAQLAAAAQRIQALEASERALQATVQLLQQQQQQHAAAAAAAGPPAFGSPADLLSDFGGDLTFAQFLPLSAIDF